MAYMLDTNIFGWLIDGKLDGNDLPIDGKFVLTHVQFDEINRTKDSDRRARLLERVSSLSPTKVPVESMVWGTAKWNEWKWGDGDLYQKIKDGLDEKNRGRTSNVADAMIGEAAIKNDYVLVTADNDFSELAAEFGATVIFFAST